MARNFCMLHAMKDKMEICGACGTVAPPGKYQCAQCHTPFEFNRIVAQPPADELIYARVCGSFKCRICGRDIALSYFSLEGFQCPECNSVERFDWTLWEDIVKHAHNVADICGFDQPDAADHAFWQVFRDLESDDLTRRFRAIGRNIESLVLTNTNPHLAQYNMEISPGRPVCVPCRLPLNIEVVDGVVVTSCMQCGVIRKYELISGFREYQFLFACVGQWHRAEIPDEDSRPTLPYPEDAPTPWWMIFQGTSPLRQRIELQLRRRSEETLRSMQKSEQRHNRALARHRRLKSKAKKRALAILLAIGISTVVVTGVVLHFI